MLFVDSSCSRQGVASLLLGQVERFADVAGIDRLTVHASITARLFFMQCGFRASPTPDSRRRQRSTTADSNRAPLSLGTFGSGLGGLGGQAAFVVAGTVRLAFAGSFVSRGVGDLVGLKRRASR